MGWYTIASMVNCHCSAIRIWIVIIRICLFWQLENSAEPFFARNRDTAVPAEGNGNLQTLICVLVARPRRCLTLSNPAPLTKLNGRLSRLHSADEDAVSWLTNYGKWHAYEKKKKLCVWFGDRKDSWTCKAQYTRRQSKNIWHSGDKNHPLSTKLTELATVSTATSCRIRPYLQQSWKYQWQSTLSPVYTRLRKSLSRKVCLG